MIQSEEKTGIEKKFFELCLEVTKQCGLTLYDMEYIPGNSLLRVYILDESTGSAQLDDCVKVDRALSPFIEEETWMPANLTLEVSSPGLFRNLKSLDHFKRGQGERVALTLKTALSLEEFPKLPRKFKGQKKIKGTIEDVTDEGLLISLNEDVYSIKFENIKKANIDPELG